MKESGKQISIVIPVKNGETWIGTCLKGIQEQNLYDKTETILIDSGSTDNTLAIASSYPVKIFEIAAADFNHGGTRNFAVSKCSGEFVVMTVQDARAAERYWLDKLLEPFEDPEIVAVCGAQGVPHDPDKNPVDWYRPHQQAAVKKLHFLPGVFKNLSPREQSDLCGWDNVNAVYRRRILLLNPFEEVVFGEDMLWAKNAFISGLALAYNRNSVVFHYHHENENYLMKRFLTSWYFRFKHFGVRPVEVKPGLRKRLSMLRTILFRSEGIRLSKFSYWWNYNSKRWTIREKTLSMFNKALDQSEAELDKLHEKYCGISPQHIATKN